MTLEKKIFKVFSNDKSKGAKLNREFHPYEKNWYQYA